MASNDDVEVKVNGSVFDGWKQVSFSNEFEKLSGQMNLSLSEQPGKPLPIYVGDKMELTLAGKRVLTGNVKSIEADNGFDAHGISIVARDKTNDLRQRKNGTNNGPCSPNQYSGLSKKDAFQCWHI